MEGCQGTTSWALAEKGFFFVVVFFFVTGLLCQETTFEQLPVFIFSLISVNVLDFAGTSKVIIPSQALFSHVCDS